jgi:hypothetical protein
MIYVALAIAIILIGQSYVILALANKESGNMKIGGQIISALVLIIAVAVLYNGSVGRGACGMKNCDMMEGKGEMMDMMKKDPSIMQDMCKNKDMRDMMQKSLKKYGK